MNDSPPTPDDDRLLSVLDQYLDALHVDDAGSASQVFERHPELAGLLSCLNALDSLTVPGDEFEAGDGPPSDPSSAETILADRLGLPPAGNGSSVVQPPIVAGEMFGKYELLRELGRGGMGVVYLARQTDLDRTVAVKMILSSRLASDDDLRRFLAESKAAGRLRHPNIVGIFEAGEIHGQHFFAMDYVSGTSLAAWGSSSGSTPEQAAECLASVARAVHYLHEQGIIHRDLKPSNILLDDDGTPHVTDFGLAQVFTEDGRMTQTGTIIGTPSYMPPEQAAGRLSELSPRSDVYSLGAILYELLTGRPPFQHDNPLDVLVDVLEGEPDRPMKLNPGVPRELELICLKCLEKDPGNRYSSAKALAADLERFLRSEPVEARPTGFGPVVRRWARREPALVSRLAGLLAAVGVVEGRYFYDHWFAEHSHETGYYLRIVGVLGTWALLSFLFQKLLHRERYEDVARFAWSAVDCILLTTAVALADGPRGMLLIGYPLLVVASSLFFRIRLVVFTTIVSLATFAVLMTIRPEEARPSHYPLMYGATLIVIGCVVAYQVHRVRALSRYYHHRSTP